MKNFSHSLSAATKNIALLIALFIGVIIVNLPVISFDMIYFEQSTIYYANQLISGPQNLLSIYLHPKMLQLAVPFFRPSGHFLLYQLMMPFLGWHNTKGLIIVNLLFLALTAFCIIKLYEALFPRYKIGGYIAASIYVMHPLLNLARLTIMHFEFAYVFFSLLSLYTFVIFCQKNSIADEDIKTKTFKHLLLLFTSLFLFVFAVTFKESAVLIGPVVICYFIIYFYARGSIKTYLSHLYVNKQVKEIILIFLITTITLLVYLTFPWLDSLYHPVRGFHIENIIAAANSFIKYLFDVRWNLLPFGDLPMTAMTWRRILYPTIVSYLLWGLLAVIIITPFLLFKRKSAESTNHQKALSFLFIAAVLFLLLPLLWGMGLPWHLSLTLVCLSMIMGFSIEFLLHQISNRTNLINRVGITMAGLIVMLTIPVNNLNIHDFKTHNPNFYFALKLNHNAIHSPPDIKNKLNQNSIIVVENSILQDDYSIGNGIYPYFISLYRPGFKYVLHNENKFFARNHNTYGGTLFKWAYLMPTLKEELYPFRVDTMEDLPNEIIHSWLQNYDNIFCLGYDRDAQWHDKTAAFKKNLLKEQVNRHISVNSYNIKIATAFEGNVFDATSLPYEDPQLCEYRCDQDILCQGFNYIYTEFNKNTIIQCKFFDTITMSEKFCAACTGYMKV